MKTSTIAMAALLCAPLPAHADETHKHIPACSEKFVEMWQNHNLDEKKYLPKDSCLIEDASISYPEGALNICKGDDCFPIFRLLEKRENNIEAQVTIINHVLLACSARFIQTWDAGTVNAPPPEKTCVMETIPGRMYVCRKVDKGCTAVMVWLDNNKLTDK
jgi:hypothetical protein